ncbi:MAG: glycoside hydrolase family 3 C-terminal domain-containing protein, partial [Bryobacteraceae bacterium]
PNAAVAVTGGGGSSSVKTTHAISPLDAVRERAGSAIQVSYAPSLPEAADLAAKADVVLVFAGDSPKVEKEGQDRESMDLPAGQNELIDAVVKANPHTVVVLNVGAPVTMPWVEQTPAVLNAWFPGEEGGHAIADILFGDVNPSGRLPETFPRRLEDSPSWGHYPGKDGVVDYADGIYVGYRHFDKQNIDPLFCFGHGLSYTKFEYTDLKVSPQEVTLKVRNTGSRDGAEVVQLYIQPLAPSIDRPVKELKAFRRIDLKHGETSTVTLTLDDRSLAYFDPAKKTWVTDPGKYEVLVGSSSRDIRLKGTVTR